MVVGLTASACCIDCIFLLQYPDGRCVTKSITSYIEKLTCCFVLKVYIYSSGSRLAQRLLFGYTNYGDLRKYLCGFFDTTVG